VLRGFHASVALEPLNRHVQALIAVRLQPKTRTAVEGFRDFIVTRPETLTLFVVSGGDDFLVLVAVPDTRHLEAFVLDHIAQHPHIADVRTSLIYEHLQRLPIEPLDAPAGSAPPTPTPVCRPPRPLTTTRRLPGAAREAEEAAWPHCGRPCRSR